VERKSAEVVDIAEKFDIAEEFDIVAAESDSADEKELEMAVGDCFDGVVRMQQN
jgi:hypothetical protein